MTVRPHAWQVGSGSQVKALAACAPDLERSLESWIEQDSSIIADDLLIIGRQISTAFGGFIDLLALDAEANLVIIELKRNQAFRESIAQALEYAAWCSGLGYEDVVRMAEGKYPTAQDLEKAFRDRFEGDMPESVNQSQRILIAAPEISDATQSVVEYLSDTFNVPINVISFGMFAVGKEQILVRQAALPESVASAKRPATTKSKPAPSIEQFFEIAKTNGSIEPLETVWQLHPYFLTPWRYANSFSFPMEVPNKKGRYLSAFGVWPGVGAIEIAMKPSNLSELFGVPIESVNSFVQRMQGEVGKRSSTWNAAWSSWTLITKEQAKLFVDEFKALVGLK